MQKLQSLANHFLIALPTLEDPFFNRSVTFICEHNTDGALGIILSMPLEANYQKLFEHLKINTDKGNSSLQQKLLAGGPVSPERGFILHSPVGNWQSSLVISDQLALSTSEDILTAIAEDKGPEKSLIALGYAGWQPGQLEKELEDNAWLVTSANQELIFNTPSEQVWAKANEDLGIDWTQLSNQEGHA